MREIKFRAWRKKEAVMDCAIYSLPLPNTTDGEYRNVVYMQFTGLKDKNGKEIYEGDVYKVAGNQEYEIVWLEELEYEEKCAGWGLKQLKGKIPVFLIDTYAIAHGEVIGNIYENPELLAPLSDKKKAHPNAAPNLKRFEQGYNPQ